MSTTESEDRSYEQIIIDLGLDPAMPPDQAFVARVFAEKLYRHDPIWATLWSSVGVLSCVSGFAVPAGQLAARLGMHLPSNMASPAQRPSTLSDMFSIGLWIPLAISIQRQLNKFPMHAASMLDALHMMRRDGVSFPDLRAMEFKNSESKWKLLAHQGLPPPHPDSLTGLQDNLQFIAVTLRNFSFMPRSLAILAPRGYVATIPAGAKYSCRISADAYDDMYSWTVTSTAGEDFEGVRNDLSKFHSVGFSVSVDTRSVCLKLDTDSALKLCGVIGPSTVLSPPIDRLIR